MLDSSLGSKYLLIDNTPFPEDLFQNWEIYHLTQ